MNKHWKVGVLVLLVGCGEVPVEEGSPRGVPSVADVTEPEPEPEPQGWLIRRGHYSLVWYPHTPEPPDPKLSMEAKTTLAKHGGTLKWHPEAPGGGQWEYRPKSDCGVGLDQYDHSASIAVILAGSHADDICRLCGARHKGKWVNPGPPPELAGCSEAVWQQIEDRYQQTEVRLGRS